MSKFRLFPTTLKAANSFVKAVHRHHDATVGHKFSIGLIDDSTDTLVGVCIVGRPVSRRLDDGLTAEVLRLCTDGSKNACSMLYSAAKKAAFAMGYTKVITYTLLSESGSSLKASGWLCEGECGGGDWSRKSRTRTYSGPQEKKLRWSVSKT